MYEEEAVQLYRRVVYIMFIPVMKIILLSLSTAVFSI